jgi:RNA polymerase sigma factor (sigma-70 family)
MAADPYDLAQVQAYLRLYTENAPIDPALAANWGEFFLVEHAYLRRLVKKTRLLRHRRDDVVQEVWIELLKNLRGFQGDRAVHKLHSWMRALVHSNAAQMIRYRINHPAESLDALTAATEPEERGKRESLENKKQTRRLELVQTWLEGLQEKDPVNHYLMVGRLVEGRSIKELAHETGLGVDVASNRIKRLKEKLRTWVLQHEDDSA